VGANPQYRTDGFEQAEDYTERVEATQAGAYIASDGSQDAILRRANQIHFPFLSFHMPLVIFEALPPRARDTVDG